LNGPVGLGVKCGGLAELWVNAKIWLGPVPLNGEIEKSSFDAVPIAQVVDASIVIGPE
jgi:hypothetical protein